MATDRDWQRLATQVRRRRERRGWTQLDVATRGSLSIDRIQAIESARNDRYSSRTLSKLEVGLEWREGSIDAILSGGDPSPIGDRPTPRRHATPEDKELQLLREIRVRVEELERLRNDPANPDRDEEAG